MQADLAASRRRPRRRSPPTSRSRSTSGSPRGSRPRRARWLVSGIVDEHVGEVAEAYAARRPATRRHARGAQLGGRAAGAPVSARWTSPPRTPPAPRTARSRARSRTASRCPAHKLVEEGARAQLLILPGSCGSTCGRCRTGCRSCRARSAAPSSAGRSTRRRSPTTARRRSRPSCPRRALPDRVLGGDAPLAGRLLVGYTRDDRHGPTHFVGHVVIQQVPADR